MTQEQYNRYMDGLVLKVASKKLNKTASITKKAGIPIFAKALLLSGGAMGAGVGGGLALKYHLANQNDKEAQPSVPEMSQNDKSWLDAAKDYGKQGVDWVKAQGKQGVDWVKAHPYITGGAATAALVAGLVGAYLLRKDNKKNTKTASFRKCAENYGITVPTLKQMASTGIPNYGDNTNFLLNAVRGYNQGLGTYNSTPSESYKPWLDRSNNYGLTVPSLMPTQEEIASVNVPLNTPDTSKSSPKKSWLDVAKDYGKQGVDWVKTHPYATAGGVATAALAAGLVGAYLLRKKSKKNTKTASLNIHMDMAQEYEKAKNNFNSFQKVKKFIEGGKAVNRDRKIVGGIGTIGGGLLAGLPAAYVGDWIARRFTKDNKRDLGTSLIGLASGIAAAYFGGNAIGSLATDKYNKGLTPRERLAELAYTTKSEWDDITR